MTVLELMQALSACLRGTLTEIDRLIAVAEEDDGDPVVIDPDPVDPDPVDPDPVDPPPVELPPDPVEPPVPAGAVTVSTPAELVAAAKGGAKMIFLAAGQYGHVALSGLSGVRIMAQNVGRVVFESLTVTDSVDVRIVDLVGRRDVSRENPATTLAGALRLDRCARIWIERGRFENWPQDGVAGGHPIYARDCQDLIVTNAEILGGQRGLQLVDLDRVAIIGCGVHDFRSVAIGGGGNNGVTIEGCDLYNAISASWPTGDHGDYIHFWTNAARGTLVDYVIRNNYLHEGDHPRAAPIMGISIQVSGGHSYRGITIENNLIVTRNDQAIRLEGCENMIIARNTCVALCEQGQRTVTTNAGSRSMSLGAAKLHMVACNGGVIDGNIWGEISARSEYGSARIGTNITYDFNELSAIFVDPAGSQRADFVARASGRGAGRGIVAE